MIPTLIPRMKIFFDVLMTRDMSRGRVLDLDPYQS
jgi:hypothetical protein